MRYNVNGKPLASHMAKIVSRLPENEITRVKQKCDVSVDVDIAYLQHRPWTDKQRPGRPYLTLEGRAHEMSAKMPFAIRTLHFVEDEALPVIFNYEFSDKELASLVTKGLYEPKFEVPEVFEMSTFNFDVDAELLIVNPTNEVKVPIVFADITNRYDLSIDNTCGYVLADYFEMAERTELTNEQHLTTDLSTDYDLEDTKESKPKTLDTKSKVEPELSDEDKFIIEQYAKIEERIKARKEAQNAPAPTVIPEVSNEEPVAELEEDTDEILYEDEISYDEHTEDVYGEYIDEFDDFTDGVVMDDEEEVDTKHDEVVEQRKSAVNQMIEDNQDSNDEPKPRVLPSSITDLVEADEKATADDYEL